MFGILKRFLGDNNDKEVKRLRAKVDEINGFEEGLKNLSDSSLARYTDKFRDCLLFIAIISVYSPSNVFSSTCILAWILWFLYCFITCGRYASAFSFCLCLFLAE